jgi:hypothetical protein
VDNGRPQKSSTARLHIEWIKKPPPSPIPLTFDEPFYNFTVMESDRVTEIVGVVSVQPANTPLWFDIVGKLETSRTVLGNVINCLEQLVKKKKEKTNNLS